MKFSFINGVKVFAPPTRQALIDYAFSNKGILVAINAEKILHATEQTRNIINRNIGYPDGFGALLALRRKSHVDVVKIPGCELWLDIIRAHWRAKTFYLVGSRDFVIQTTIEHLNEEYPGIRILGYRNGYLTNHEDKRALIADIAEKKPDIVFVAMGSPKQELLMEEMHRAHSAVYLGLGGSFDLYTGQVRRASAWWVEHHLEWLYRLLQEPTRIKRQIHLFRFLFCLYAGLY